MLCRGFHAASPPPLDRLSCDTTCTFYFSNPKAEQIEAYTKVLKGRTVLDSVIYLEGTTGAQLCVLTQSAMEGWHELRPYQWTRRRKPPQGVRTTALPLQQRPSELGHVITSEPGFYKEGEWDVRIESAMVVKQVDAKGKFGGDIWLGFEWFTQVPI